MSPSFQSPILVDMMKTGDKKAVSKLMIQLFYYIVSQYVLRDFTGKFYLIKNVGEVVHDCGLINGTENDFLVMGR